MQLLEDAELMSLTAEEFSFVEKHRKSCEACARLVSLNQSFDSALASFRDEEIAFRNRLMPEISQSVMNEILPPKTRPIWSYAMAAVIVFFALLDLWLYRAEQPLNKAVLSDNSLAAAIEVKNGSFSLHKGSNWIQGSAGTFSLPLEIRTPSFSSLDINFPGVAEMRLKPNTVLRIEQNCLFLTQGRSLFSFNHLQAPFFIKSSLGQVKIVGTRLLVSAGSDKLRVSLIEGKIEISNRFTNATLNAGEETLIEAGTEKIQAYKISDQLMSEIRNWDKAESTAISPAGTSQPSESEDNILVPDIFKEFERLKGLDIQQFR